MTERREPLDAPVVVDRFWRNRRGECVVTTLTSFEGRNIIDLRTHFTTKEGALQPTKKGLTLTVNKLPELAAALRKAVTKATELGLIDEVSE
jgi:hypothetical protein